MKSQFVEMVSEAIRLDLIKVEPRIGMSFYNLHNGSYGFVKRKQVGVGGIVLEYAFFDIDENRQHIDDNVLLPSQEDLQNMLKKSKNGWWVYGDACSLLKDFHKYAMQHPELTDEIQIMLGFTINKLNGKEYIWDGKTWKDKEEKQP